MASLKTVVVTALMASAYALPPVQRVSARRLKYHSLAVRQNAAAEKQGLSDVDILQFALTLENLESSFYREGFAKFPDAEFAALGLNERAISDLKSIGKTEEQHVGLLQSAVAQAGIQPVQPCTYNFNLTDAKSMVATAAVLENVGVSAYLGAAPLVSDKGILTTAASIVTIESRHQSAIRIFSGTSAIPQAFDAPLNPRSVFTLAAPFIKECPQGSNLAIQPFPALSMDSPGPAQVGSTISVTAANTAEAKFCAFTSGGVSPGDTMFTPLTDGRNCVVPSVAGVSYLSLTKEAPLDGVLKDDLILAGPMVVTVT
ncbi:hypothetical protein RJ55_05373 [Drechmeria coniospora]|nr:hypothetical protein RJ55_05373 [Drechmeria coniospora]